MKKKLFIFGGGGLLLLIVLANLLSGEGGGLEVTAEAAARGEVVSRVSASGKIYPVTEVKINSEVSARIDRLLVVEDQFVERGQVLAQLDQTQYEARVEGARALLNTQKANADAAQATLNQAEDALAIARAMAEQEVGAQQDMKDARNGYDAARARYTASLSQVTSAEASLDQALEDLARTTLRAPMEGTVTALSVEEGEMVLGTQMTMGTQLMAIADLSRMEVEVDVDETDVVAVALGQLAEVEVDALPDTIFTGIVTEIANAGVTLGAGTQMEVTNFAVKVELFGSDPRLKYGMSAAVDVITETHEDVVFIPMQALTARRKSDLVVSNVVEEEAAGNTPGADEDEYAEVAFVVTDEGTVELRVVETGISGTTHIEIISGLDEGEQVVTGPFRLLSRTLKDGDRVTVTDSLLEDGSDR